MGQGKEGGNASYCEVSLAIMRQTLSSTRRCAEATRLQVPSHQEGRVMSALTEFLSKQMLLLGAVFISAVNIYKPQHFCFTSELVQIAGCTSATPPSLC